MKKYVKILALALAAICLLSACTPATDGENTDTGDTLAPDSGTQNTGDTGDTGNSSGGDDAVKDDRYGTALNIDPDALTYMYNEYGDAMFNDLEAASLKWFEDRYADCGISDILYDLEGTVPSEVREDKIDKYTQKTETLSDGTVVNVDYSQNTGMMVSHKVYTETSVDPYAVWFEKCREEGINPWLSFRMNDVHSANERTGHTEFFYTAQKNGWMIGNARSSYWYANECTLGSRNWYPYAMDYSVPEVRQYFLDFIDEQLGKYDAYGIELDWQRTIWCFKTDDVANCQYMNEFMEKVNEIVAKYEEKYGHEIKIMARINRDIDENKYFGFDVREWATKDWIDVVVPASYWGSTDTEIPVAAWKKALEGYDIEIWPGVECHIFEGSTTYWQSIATLAGQTAAYLSAGADKMYLYNMFNDIKAKFTVCASLSNALAAAKRSYIVTEHNCMPYTTVHKEYDPLPMALQVNEPKSVTVNHGTLDYTKDTVIYVAIQGVSESEIDADTLTVTYNGVQCSYRGTSAKSYLAGSTSKGTVVCYAIPKTDIKDSTSGEITFDPGTNITVTYVEVMNGNTRM